MAKKKKTYCFRCPVKSGEAFYKKGESYELSTEEYNTLKQYICEKCDIRKKKTCKTCVK